MVKKKLVFLALVFFIGIIFTPLSAQTPDMSAIHRGMSKDELYKVYPKNYQLKYFQDQNREMILFDDYLTPDPGDTITFYIRDGRVQWWDKEKFSPTPEDRLNAILNRAQHVDTSSHADVVHDTAVMNIKANDRRDNMGESNSQKYYKSKLTGN